MTPARHLAILFLTLISTAFAQVKPLDRVPWHVTPPAGSGVVNVRDYGAKGDGKTDDTEAIAKAISDNIDKSRYRANAFIWFPEGTYLVSGPIEGRILGEGREEGKVWSAGWRSMLLLIGETQDGTVIKLADEAPGYGDPEKPKWVIATGSESDKNDNFPGGGNRAFRHGIYNLTVDVGRGNPGAIGIDFVANNRGAIEDVTLRGEHSGWTAINLERWWPGPCMIENVRIDGFDHAFRLGHYQYGVTFENLRLRGQRKTAITNYANVAVMRNIDFESDQPFYETGHHKSVLALLDSTIKGPGGDAAAIVSPGHLSLRRVHFEGYAKLVRNPGRDGKKTEADKDLAANDDGPSTVSLYQQGFTLNTAGGPAKPLDLPIEEIPYARPPKGAEWTDGGGTSESLQAAIDSGAEWIFLRPLEAVRFDKPVILRNKVRLIMGMSAWVIGPAGEKDVSNDAPPAFIMGDGSADQVILEHIHISGRVENPSKRTLALRHCDVEQFGVLADGPGKTHVIDVIGRNYRIGKGHTFWARQLNAEFGPDPLFTNAGTSCILGFKMESSTTGSKDAPEGTPSLMNLAGQLEVIGGFLYTLGDKREQAPKVPAFTNLGGTLSVMYRVNGRPETYYPLILRKGKGSTAKEIPASEIQDPGAVQLRDE